MTIEPLEAGFASLIASAVALAVRFVKQYLWRSLTAAQARIAELEAQLHDARVKTSPELLARYADEAVAYAEQMGGDAKAKLRTALEACKLRDAGDNGKRDWTDAEHRIAIEAAVGRLKK